MRQWLAMLLSAGLVCAAGCEDGGRGVPGGGGSTDAGSGEDGRIEPGDTVLPDDTVILEDGGDGTESGASVVDGRGVVYFYSQRHQAFWQIDVVDEEGMPAASGSEVHLEVDASGMGRYLIFDPSGQHVPMVFAADMPAEGTADTTVDALDLLEADDPFVEFEEDPPNPYALTIGGITIAIRIQAVMRSIAWGAALSVLKTFLVGACNTVAPLYDDICRIVGEVVEFLGNFVRPGFKLATGAIALKAAATEIVGNLIEYAAGKACGFVAGAVIKALDENDPAVTDLRDAYRAAVYEYHYLLWKRENDPPADAGDLADLDATLRAVGRQLAVIGPHVREGYVTILNTSASSATEGPIYSRVIDATKEVVTAAPHRVVWQDVITVKTAQALFGPLPTGGVVLVDVPVGYIKESRRTLEQIDPTLAKSAWSCTLSVWQELEVDWREGAMMQTERLGMPILFDQAVAASRGLMSELHADLWGGDIPDADCTFDEYEPNSTWESAVASPTITLTSDPVWLRDLTLCTIMGTPAEDDWYAFPMGAIEFNIEARIREPDNTMFRFGGSEPICMEMLYYGQSNELAGTPPTSVAGPSCGTVSASFNVGPVGVRRAIGESWSYILIHVRPDRGASMPVGYDLGFTL